MAHGERTDMVVEGCFNLWWMGDLFGGGEDLMTLSNAMRYIPDEDDWMFALALTEFAFLVMAEDYPGQSVSVGSFSALISVGADGGVKRNAIFHDLVVDGIPAIKHPGFPFDGEPAPIFQGIFEAVAGSGWLSLNQWTGVSLRHTWELNGHNFVPGG